MKCIVLAVVGLALAVSTFAEPRDEPDNTDTSPAKENDRPFEPWGGKNLPLDELLKEFDWTPSFKEERREFWEKVGMEDGDPRYSEPPTCVDAALAGLSTGGTVKATTVMQLDGSASKGILVRWGEGDSEQIAATHCEDPTDMLPDPLDVVP